MTEPTITCPNCKTEIRLTESLAAPLLATSRRQFEEQLARKDAELAGKLAAERAQIAASEAQKARLLVQTDLEQGAQQVKDLQAMLAERDRKLAEAQCLV